MGLNFSHYNCPTCLHLEVTVSVNLVSITSYTLMMLCAKEFTKIPNVFPISKYCSVRY